MKNTYIFSPEAKGFFVKGLIAGIVILLVGIFLNFSNSELPLRTLLVGNIYTVALYAFWISVAALFFISGTTLALGAWQIQIQKIVLSIAGFLPIAIGMMTIVFLFFYQDLFHWTHTELYDVNSPKYDALLDSKRDYLNLPRFWVFTIILFVMTLALNYFWNKNLKTMDESPSIKVFDKSRALAAVSIVLIAMLINTFGTWDWAMSVQPHWYSTMYSWYLMASAAVGMLSIVYLMMLHLQKNNYLPNVNENHRHDIVKLIFAISVFWTYVWFAQYLLIWYANIPEETFYFTVRQEGYPVLFFATIVINFLFPFLALMKRSFKRLVTPGLVISIILIFGHWMDFFSMIVPELLPQGGGFGLVGLGAFITIGSMFGYVTLMTLSGYKDLESSTHPYVKESYNHNI